MWNGIFSFLTFYCILEFLFPLYRAYDRHTTLFFSIQWARFPNTIYQMTYHFLLVLKYQPCYISGPPGPSPGLHILIYFLFSICLLLWQKDTYKKCYGSDTCEWVEGRSQQPMLVYHLVGDTYCSFFCKASWGPRQTPQARGKAKITGNTRRLTIPSDFKHSSLETHKCGWL